MPDGTELRPTGKQVTFPAVIVLVIHEGQATQSRTYFDQLPLLAQLGLFPQPG